MTGRTAGAMLERPATQPTGLPVVRTHLDRMRGRYGLFQHAHGVVPAPEHGFCTDDVARALSLDLRHMRRGPSPSIAEDIRVGIAFLEAAFVDRTGRFRNLRAADGTWLDDIGSEDCHGRAIAGLADAIRLAPDADVRERAAELLARALPAVATLHAWRPLAYSVLGCVTVAEDGRAGDLAGACRETARAAATRIADAPGWDDAEWPWPEDIVTYEAPVIPSALVAAGRLGGDGRWIETGLRVLRWLAEAEMTVAGMFRPIGNHGWWPRGGRPAADEAQPIEAASMIAAAAEAWRTTHDDDWLRVARSAWGWFLGANGTGLMVADPMDGSCHDGLGADGLNRDRGAESTLAWLASVEVMAALGSPRSVHGAHRGMTWGTTPTVRR